MIQVLHSSVINRDKWDATVSRESNAKIYSMSWFLDAVASDHWSALVLDDYTEVLPFVAGQKWGISYCYMPYLTQQFTIYESSSYLPLFIKELRSRYLYGQLSISKSHPGITTAERNNFELSLDKDYGLLRQSFSSNHKMNINRFKKGACEIKYSEDISSLITLFVNEKSSAFRAKELQKISTNILNVFNAAAAKGLARLYYAHDEEGIVGGAFFIEDKNRLYYLFGVAKRKLKHSQSVSYGLLDHVIQYYSGRPFVLDFEGSQIESISYFFKGFGATNHPYYTVKWNDLPFFVKWIKR